MFEDTDVNVHTGKRGETAWNSKSEMWGSEEMAQLAEDLLS